MPFSKPVNYYLAADVRELDRLAIIEHQIPGFTLMQRAGKAALHAILETWPDTQHLLCFCGSGNNGGDGYVIAALAREKGIQVKLVAVDSTENLTGDARLAFELATEQGVSPVPFQLFNVEHYLKYQGECVVVDALLGTGLKGQVRGNYLKAIELINAINFPVLAVDIPSGLCSDTGKILGKAVHADLTITFIGRKLGQIINKGPKICGELVFDDLDVPAEIYAQVSPAQF